MSGLQKDCGLVMDEMSLDECQEYCQNTKQLVGTTTLPSSCHLATKGLVLMLVGISDRSKQVVGFEFTSSSFPRNCLKQLVIETIHNAETIGLRVHFLTSDSGAENQRMWSDLGVNFGKEAAKWDQSIPHLMDKNRELEIIPDPVHVFKNLAHGWINNKFMTLPDWYVAKNGLTSNEMLRDHLRTLVNFEKGNQLRMCHRLTEDDVNFENPISSVDKMKVCNATKFCNTAVAAALRVVASETGQFALNSTARVIEDIANWFNVINNRNKEDGLSKTSNDEFAFKISKLEDMVKLVLELKVGDTGRWKP
ncbi:uncharacterized protein LOC129728565 [Wyeomyia smithii]|uniref:uncharacterized protein LOC129728565 n=1 Tax=Wyeomyia smithii TaxID=174621 RepID=UPI002467FCEC|nr:uncharacterized protein LOC129728565 [Wyeomyia smithii]